MSNFQPLLLCSAILAVCFDQMFHDSIVSGAPIGLGLSAMVISFIAVLIFMAVKTKLPGRRRSLYFLMPALLLSIGCVWRDSHTLCALDGYLIIFFLFMSSASMQGCKMLAAGVSRYLQLLFCLYDSLLIKPFDLLLVKLNWSEFNSQNQNAKVAAVLRGLLISLPLLFTFGCLLASADAAFEGIIKKGLQFNYNSVVNHTSIVIFAFLGACGFLHAMFSGKLQSKDISLDDMPKFTLGAIEVCTITGALNFLFLSFVIVQFQYFFGGASVVALTNGLTYAEYARRGFFELVTVVSLVLPLLLFLDWSFLKKSRTGIFIFRGLTLLQISMLFVMMAAAVKRMMLYQCEYGQTELRLYTTAFMGLIAIIFIIFSFTVLRGYRSSFAFASIMAGLAVTAALHFANPDAMIVQANLERAQHGKAFDVDYNLSLSKDAVPVLVAGMKGLNEQDQTRVKYYLNYGYANATRYRDWRHWNWSRAQADKTIGQKLRTIGMNSQLSGPKNAESTGKI